jgi:hypothetical protein
LPSTCSYLIGDSSRLDLSELGTLPGTCQVTYPNKDDLLHFMLTITPDDVSTLRARSPLCLSLSCILTGMFVDCAGLLSRRSFHILVHDRIGISSFAAESEMHSEDLSSEYRSRRQRLSEYSPVGGHTHVQHTSDACPFREDWKPVLTILSVILGMGFLFSVNLFARSLISLTRTHLGAQSRRSIE